MNEMLSSSLFFGVVLSLTSYFAGIMLKKRFPIALFNPLLISAASTILVLTVLSIDYQSYLKSAGWLNYLLTPSTVCLALPLYEQVHALKKNFRPVLISTAAGTLSGLITVLWLSAAFGLTHSQYVTLLPKSVSSAIALSLSEELGGIRSLTAAAVVITGIFGNITAETVLKLARIEEPAAKGLACGTAAHAIGTAKAAEMGETEAAMSSLALVAAGLITVFTASFFADLY